MSIGHEAETEVGCHLDLNGDLRIEHILVGPMGQDQILRGQEESNPKGYHVGRVGVGEKENAYVYAYDVCSDSYSYSYSEYEVTCPSAIGHGHGHHNAHCDS